MAFVKDPQPLYLTPITMGIISGQGVFYWGVLHFCYITYSGHSFQSQSGMCPPIPSGSDWFWKHTLAWFDVGPLRPVGSERVKLQFNKVF